MSINLFFLTTTVLSVDLATTAAPVASSSDYVMERVDEENSASVGIELIAGIATATVCLLLGSFAIILVMLIVIRLVVTKINAI